MKYRFLIIPDDIENIKDEIIKVKKNREKMWSETQELIKNVGANNILIDSDFGTIKGFGFKEEPDKKYWKQYGKMKKTENGEFSKFPKANTIWGKSIIKEINKINKIGSLLDTSGNVVLNKLKLNVWVPDNSRNRYGFIICCSSCCYIEDENVFIARLPISQKTDNIITNIKETHPKCIEIKESGFIAITEEKVSVEYIIKRYTENPI